MLLIVSGSPDVFTTGYAGLESLALSKVETFKTICSVLQRLKTPFSYWRSITYNSIKPCGADPNCAKERFAPQYAT